MCFRQQDAATWHSKKAAAGSMIQIKHQSGIWKKTIKIKTDPREGHLTI